MKNFLQTIFSTSEERIRNPFIMSFLIALLGINWKHILILIFSTKDIEAKLLAISECPQLVALKLFLALLISISYIVILPHLMAFFDKKTTKAMIARRNSAYEIKEAEVEAKTRIARSESILENVKADFKETAVLNRKIETLERELQSSVHEIERMSSESNTLAEQRKSLEGKLANITDEYNKLVEERSRDFDENEKNKDTYEKTPENDIDEYITLIANLAIEGDVSQIDEDLTKKIPYFIAIGLLDRSSDKKLNITKRGLYFIRHYFNKQRIG